MSLYDPFQFSLFEILHPWLNPWRNRWFKLSILFIWDSKKCKCNLVHSCSFNSLYLRFQSRDGQEYNIYTFHLSILFIWDSAFSLKNVLGDFFNLSILFIWDSVKGYEDHYPETSFQFSLFEIHKYWRCFNWVRCTWLSILFIWDSWPKKNVWNWSNIFQFSLFEIHREVSDFKQGLIFQFSLFEIQ